MDLKKAGVEDVSGATMTSLAVAEGIVHRFRVAQGELRPQSVRVGVRDFGLVTVVALGAWLTFTTRAGRERWRRWFQWLVIGYVGLLNGDLLAQSLLAAAALAVAWAAKRPLYCQQLCPHGAAQEIVSRLAPLHWRVRVPAPLDLALRWLPGVLLLAVLFVVMLPLDFDLAGLCPPYLNVSEFRKDYNLGMAFAAVLQTSSPLQEGLEDTAGAVGNEAYKSALVFYHAVQQAAQLNVPGADTIADDLAQRFAGQGPSAPPPPNPPNP